MMESGFLEQVSPFFSLLPFKGYNLFLYLTLHSISFKRFFFLFVAVGAKMGFFFFLQTIVEVSLVEFLCAGTVVPSVLRKLQ